jgi:site-specific recombinase XerD
MPDKIHKIPYPKLDRKLPIVLSQDEVQKMFDVCENIKHKVILALLYSCGLRASELINLKWNHLDRQRSVINIIAGKGRKDRQVKLSDTLIPLLEKYYRIYKSKTYVLNGQFSDQYTQSSLLKVIKQVAIKANISKRTYTHLLRHCTFTHMVEKGMDISLISKVAGHNSTKTTMIYCHISDVIIKNTISPLDSIKL